MLAGATEHTPDLALSIGNVVGWFRLREASPALLAAIHDRMGVFALPRSVLAAPAFVLAIRFRAPGPAPRQAWALPQQPALRATPDRIETERWDFSATLGRRPAGAVLEGQADCHASPFAFESLLRVLWSVFLPRAGGALFHACGFRHGDRAILAPGPSGAGKSTLARKVPLAADVLSDEVVAIHRQPAGGGWAAAATPFFGELQRGGLSAQSWPLAAIAFLEHRPGLQITSLTAAEAVLRALACLMSWDNDQQAAERSLALVIDLCDAVPALACGSRADTPIAEMFAAMNAAMASFPAV